MPKKEKVQQMFDNIAPTYDKLNHIMSLSVDKLWRRHALREIVDGRDQRILDIACGTGDSTIAIARKASDGSRVVGTDISDGMMALVRRKAIDRGVDWKIEVEQATGKPSGSGRGVSMRSPASSASATSSTRNAVSPRCSGS